MIFPGKTESGLALVLLCLKSHSFALGQPSGARGTFSVVSGGAEAAILLTRGGFLLRHREGLKVAFLFARRSVFITASGACGAQRWVFITSPGAQMRFSQFRLGGVLYGVSNYINCTVGTCYLKCKGRSICTCTGKSHFMIEAS